MMDGSNLQSCINAVTQNLTLSDISGESRNYLNVRGIIYSCMLLSLFFFFQAEDGIRDLTVTGVQTCALPICWPWRVQHMQLGNPVSGFLDRVRPFLKDDKGARMFGAGTNKPYGEKDETLVAELEKQRAKRPEDMALAARWLIALHNARGAEAALTEIDKLLAMYPESRELRSVRIDIVDEDDLDYSTAWRKAVDD